VLELLRDQNHKASDQLEGALKVEHPELKRISWTLYWGYWFLTLVAAIPSLSWLGVIGYIALVIVALMKMGDAVDTIYESHFRNYVLVAIIGTVGLILALLFMFLNEAVSLLIAAVLIVLVLVWSAYRIIKGMLRLNSGRAFRD